MKKICIYIILILVYKNTYSQEANFCVNIKIDSVIYNNEDITIIMDINVKNKSNKRKFIYIEPSGSYTNSKDYFSIYGNDSIYLYFYNLNDGYLNHEKIKIKPQKDFCLKLILHLNEYTSRYNLYSLNKFYYEKYSFQYFFYYNENFYESNIIEFLTNN